MTGVNSRRIWRVLRDIKYYKINTGNSVLIRGKKSKKKCKHGIRTPTKIYFDAVNGMRDLLT